jgi:hypothetical protein
VSGHRHDPTQPAGARSVHNTVYLTIPGLLLRPDRLPAYSPDFNADEAIWGWIRAEVTANTCFGTKAKVRKKVGEFFHRLADRTEEVKRRCRTILQTKADVFTSAVEAILQSPSHVVPTLAWLWFRNSPTLHNLNATFDGEPDGVSDDCRRVAMGPGEGGVSRSGRRHARC